MDLRELRAQLGLTQQGFAERYDIPFRTVQNWETGLRRPPEYMARLLEYRIRNDLINCKTTVLPEYDPRKMDLPTRRDYVGALSWLKAIRNVISEDFVFALDEALMCQGLFGGRNDEYIVWVYGSDALSRFNGIVVLGNRISRYCVQEKNGLRFTDLNRTLSDSMANESILDFQGITEALSRYYYSNNESFLGVSVAPEYQERFERLADDATDYYSN